MKQLKAISFPRSGVSIFCKILIDYYKDTPKNRELVQIYLDSVGLEWKQLIEANKPIKEEEE